jgi:hypothetical protein
VTAVQQYWLIEDQDAFLISPLYPVLYDGDGTAGGTTAHAESLTGITSPDGGDILGVAAVPLGLTLTSIVVVADIPEDPGASTVAGSSAVPLGLTITNLVVTADIPEDPGASTVTGVAADAQSLTVTTVVVTYNNLEDPGASTVGGVLPLAVSLVIS